MLKLLFGLLWREKAARFNGEGIDVLWKGYREGFLRVLALFSLTLVF